MFSLRKFIEWYTQNMFSFMIYYNTKLKTFAWGRCLKIEFHIFYCQGQCEKRRNMGAVESTAQSRVYTPPPHPTTYQPVGHHTLGLGPCFHILILRELDTFPEVPYNILGYASPYEIKYLGSITTIGKFLMKKITGAVNQSSDLESSLQKTSFN